MAALGLRRRFILVGALLVATTVASAVWSALTFARLSRAVGEALRDSEAATVATAALSSALEREDDALLLSLGGDVERARRDVVAQRARVEASLRQVSAVLAAPIEQAMVASFRRDVEAYHAAGDALLDAAGQPDAHDRYHHDVNPLLRRAVGAAARIRDEHFRGAQEIAAYARDETSRATSIVSGIALCALVLSTLAAFHLARVVIWPLRQLSRSVEAIRHGDFEHRIPATSADELGRLAEGFNRMAEDLGELRRSNVGEVLRAKETLEATLAALPDAVMVVDPDGGIASLNAAAGEVLRTATGARPARLDDLLLPAGAMQAIHLALEGRPSGDAAVDLARAIAVSQDGEERKLLPRVVPVPGFAAGRQGAVLVLYDVTELVRLDEMRVELVAVASHELRTPLTTMRMTLAMLGEGAQALTTRQQDLLSTALLGVEQLAATIDEFLDLTRIEAGQLRLTWDRVDARALVSEAVRAIRPRCDEAGVKVATELDEGAPTIWADAARLKVVLANVLTNAVKYVPQGGTIEVRTALSASAASPGAPMLHVAVTDTGPGIPEEYRERVFEKFFRVEHHRDREDEGVKGAGIGLYLSRQIVEAHGGAIRCEAGPGGSGTRIMLALPVGRPEGPSA
jgi:two-component system, NtrC family, sensor histidine kinase KinB